MHPLEWERKHQIALILAAIVGAALGFVIGYIVFRYGGVWWALFGAALGAGLIYFNRMISN